MFETVLEGSRSVDQWISGQVEQGVSGNRGSLVRGVLRETVSVWGIDLIYLGVCIYDVVLHQC